MMNGSASGQGSKNVICPVEARREPLDNAGMTPEDLDLIIVATVSADTYVPSTSCQVQGEIGAIRATCFDLNAACSGFLFSMNTANAYLEMGMAKTALVRPQYLYSLW